MEPKPVKSPIRAASHIPFAGLAVFLFCLLFVFQSLGAQTIFDDWRIRFPNPPSNALYTATYAEGRFIAAGEHATVVSSVTGNVWETRYLKADFRTTGLVYADGIYVMVDWDGQVAVSDNLNAWRVERIGASSLRDLIHAEGRFIAVGRLSQVFSSPDGNSWTEARVAEENFDLQAIAYGDEQYLTVARGGKVFRSTDLEQWTEVFAGFPGTENMTDNWKGIVFFNGRFIAYGPTERMLTSPNGTDWTEIPLTFESSLEDHVEWNGRIWISGGSDAILHSADGLSWERISLGEDVSTEAIAASPEGLVALAGGGDVYASPDGTAWTLVVEREFDDMVGVAYQNNTYVAIADKKRFLRSVDGVNWSVVFDARDTSVLYEGIGAVGGRFVAVSSRGQIAWSTDGLDWDTATSVDLTAIARTVSVANGVLFAGCDSGYLASTTDGLNWTEQRINDSGNGTLHGIEQVSHFNGTYYATGSNGFLARSTDLSNWENLPLGGATAAFKKLLYYNNRYILLPVSGSRVLFSDDLVTWTDDRRVPVIRATGGWVYDGRIVVSSLSAVYTSEDGATFVEHALPFTGFRGITFDGTQYVGVGGSSVIATTGGQPLSALQLAIDGDGSVDLSPDQALYDSSTIVRLTANPASGQQFLWWETADGVVQAPFVDLVLTADTNVKAVFAGIEPPLPALVVSPGNVVLQWPRDDGWLLFKSSNLVDWSQVPGVSLTDTQGSLDPALPDAGNLFFQFRLREP